MKPLHISILISVFLFSSCRSVKETTCNSDHLFENYYSSVGFKPIELDVSDTIIRIWIEKSSSETNILSIYKDSSDYFGEFTEFGFKYKNGFLKKNRRRSFYEQTQVCPKQGWETFIKDLDSWNFFKKSDRLLTIKDGIMMGGIPISLYLIEIKNNKEIKRYRFYSHFPDPYFPEDMKDYKNIERIIYTSFNVLEKKLRIYQDYYKDRCKFEY